MRFMRILAVASVTAAASHAQTPVLLTPDPMVVEPGHYMVQEFSGGHIYGKFRITNPKNDIKCMVLDEEGYLNFQGGHKLRGYYFSGEVAAGSFNLNLEWGQKHYLIFSNTHSVLASATVVVKAEIYVEPPR